MRQTFEIGFDLGNEAFDEPQKRREEIGRLLRETAGRVADGSTSGGVYDVNGNHAGKWGFDEIEEEDSFACSVCAERVPIDRSACPNCGEDFRDPDRLRDDQQDREMDEAR